LKSGASHAEPRNCAVQTGDYPVRVSQGAQNVLALQAFEPGRSRRWSRRCAGLRRARRDRYVGPIWRIRSRIAGGKPNWMSLTKATTPLTRFASASAWSFRL
jgi:hypothetical protein